MTVESLATLQVFTLKEGLLARLGHDLRLSFTRFEVECEHGQVAVRVALSSLSVDGAVSDGEIDGHALDAGDREKVLHSARDEVLHVTKHAEARYAGRARQVDADHFEIDGSLSLHGVSAPVQVRVQLRARVLVAEATLTPSQFGIKPFRALAGAIRIRDHARIVARLALPDSQSVAALLTSHLHFGSV